MFVVLAALVGTLLSPAGAASADDGTEQVGTAVADLTATAPIRRVAGKVGPIHVELTGAEGPIAGAPVRIDRHAHGKWRQVGDIVTGEHGQGWLSVKPWRKRENNLFRAVFAGDETHGAARDRVRFRLIRRRTVATIAGPDRLKDGVRGRLRFRVRTGDGLPVRTRVEVRRSRAGGPWKLQRVLTTGERGLARMRIRPRVNTRWKAWARVTDWTAGDRAPAHRVVNRPNASPVSLPRGAPTPRIGLPKQRRADRFGARPVVRRIPDRVWKHMVGRSWHRGCPVGRKRLRLIRVNYFSYDGYRYRGEVVAHADVAHRIAHALAAMHDRRFPIRSMYRVDRFGWSSRLNGANDYRSMAAGNTSAFNCRDVVGRPGVRSPHSWGRSLDVNPWENPYWSRRDGWLPNGWWVGRAHRRVAWRSSKHPVVRLMRNHGLHWTYGTTDAHHFDATSGAGRLSARQLYPQCADFVCK